MTIRIDHRIWLKALLFFFLSLAGQPVLFAQLELRVVVQSGSASTSCRDFFSLADAQWSVLINTVEWVTYPATAFCFNSLPNVQYTQQIDCRANAPDIIQVCFRAFDNDGNGCSVKMDCMEEICEFYEIPLVGEIVDHTLALPAGGKSSGQLHFSIGLMGEPLRADNDFLCDAVDFGIVTLGATVGDARSGNYSNYCATSEGDPNPFQYGFWGNDRAVWFSFQTDDNPGSALSIIGKSDPEVTGDPVDLQFALYQSPEGDCAEEITFVGQSYDWTDPDEELTLHCPPPNTHYYLLVDGPEGSDLVEGRFGLAIVDNGEAQGHQQIDTVLCFGESLRVGNKTYSSTGNYFNTFSEPGKCEWTVATRVEVLDELKAFAEQMEMVSFEGRSDGKARVSASGGSGEYQYSWSTGNTTAAIEKLSAGSYCVTVTDDRGCSAEACVYIETDLFPIKIDLQSGTLSCYGDENGELALRLSGGEEPYQVSWKIQGAAFGGSMPIPVADETYVISDLPGGQYRLTISDHSGLSTSVFTEVKEPSPIVTRIDTVICYGSNLLVGNHWYDSEGPIEQWLIADNGCDSLVTGQLIILPLIEQEVEVMRCHGDPFIYADQSYEESTEIYKTYTATSGCDSNVLIHLLFLDQLHVELDQYQLASGYARADAALRARVSGGAGPYQLQWSDGQQGPTPLALKGGAEYCLRVADQAGCTKEQCINIQYHSDNIVQVQSDTLRCANSSDGRLLIYPGWGQAPYTYSWQNSAGTLSGKGTIGTNDEVGIIDALPAGSYEISFSDANVSTQKMAQVVDIAPLTLKLLQKRDLSCRGFCDGLIELEVEGGAGPYQMNWSDGLAPGNKQEKLCASQYELQVLDANNCLLSEYFTITEPEVPLSTALEIVAQPSCHGLSDGIARANIYGAEQGSSISWSNGQQEVLAENLSAGMYYLTVTNGANCAVEDSVLIEEPKPLDFELEAQDPNCWEGQSSGRIQIVGLKGGTGPYLHAINQRSLQGKRIFERLGAGNYSIITEDSNGCLFEKTVDLFPPEHPTFQLSSQAETHLGEPLQLHLAGNISGWQIEWWINDSLACADCSAFSYLPLHNAGLRITATDPVNGCQSTLKTEVRVIKDRESFIPTAFSPNDDGINDLFRIYAGPSVRSIISFKIFDRHGALVHQASDFLPEAKEAFWTGRFKNRDLPLGVYVYWAELEYLDGERLIVKGDVSLLR